MEILHWKHLYKLLGINCDFLVLQTSQIILDSFIIWILLNSDNEISDNLCPLGHSSIEILNSSTLITQSSRQKGHIISFDCFKSGLNFYIELSSPVSVSVLFLFSASLISWTIICKGFSLVFKSSTLKFSFNSLPL